MVTKKSTFDLGLHAYIVFTFLSCDRFVIFVQTTHTSEPHQESRDPLPRTESTHHKLFNEINCSESRSHITDSQTLHDHIPQNTSRFSRSHDQFHSRESPMHALPSTSFQSHEAYSEAINHLTSIISKVFQSTLSHVHQVGAYRSTPTRASFSKLNNTNYWPYNMDRVRLPRGYQSPIDINTVLIEEINMPPLDTHSYEEVNDSSALICFNTGQTIECKLKNGTKPPFIRGGPLLSKFIFDNMHWHWGSDTAGSEHYINGMPYAAEVHVVHYNEKYGSFIKAKKKQDGLAIFGLFATHTATNNTDLNTHFADIPHILLPNQTRECKWNDVFKFINRIVLSNQQWMTYPGAMTSAPFTESVTWLIFFQCFNISNHQLETLRSTMTIDGHAHITHRKPLFESNNRPLLARIGTRKGRGRFEEPSIPIYDS